MQTTLYDLYAAAALTGMTVNTQNVDYIEGVAAKASDIAIEMLELRRGHADKLRTFGIELNLCADCRKQECADELIRLLKKENAELKLEAEYLDGLADDRQ